MFKKFLCIFCCFFSPLIWSLFPSLQIDAFLKKHLPHEHVGIVILDAKTGQLLYNKQGEQYFPPASSTKLLTAVAALQALGPDYRFATTIQVDNANHLFIHFCGDPSLTTFELRKLIGALKGQGFKKITQDITIDNTHFSPPNYALGWTWDSLFWYYGAPVTATILNQNQVTVMVTSAQKLGSPAKVSLLPTELFNLNLSSELITVAPEVAKTQCQFQSEMTAQNVLHVKGCWPYNPTPSLLKLAIKNPDKLVSETLVAILKAEQIEFTGKILFAKKPTHLRTVAVHYSLPLNQLLKKVLEDSNNLYAESITKTLGIHYLQQGTFQAGTLAIKDILSKMTDIDFTSLPMADGSGLSRYNLITPQQLARVLYVIYQHKSLYKLFKSTLPVSGKNGTLKNRMLDPKLQGRIWAKTGSQTAVSTLAGYLTTLSNKTRIVVIMLDHILLDNKVAKEIEDEICRILILE